MNSTSTTRSAAEVLTANIAAAVRAFLKLHAVTANGYSIRIPGEDPIGNYPTALDALGALHYLPLSVQRRATICDADGIALET